MKLEDFWAELKERRVTRVAVAYVAVAAVIVNGADLTFGALGLPPWTYTFLVVVSIAGFPVAVVLAWAFDVTSGSVERTGRAQLPLWLVGRWVAVLGLTGALLLGGWLVLGPANGDPADVDSALMAVVPFRVSGPDSELESVIREGILDLLSPHLSESPRMIDAGAMVTAWRAAVGGEEEDLSEDEAVGLARQLGAGRLLVGSVVGTADAFTATARLIEVPGGDRIGDVTIDGALGRLGEMASQLSGAVLTMEAGEAPDRVAYLSDVPNEALQHYLEGRRLYRRTAYLESREAYSRALDVDSTFALAALGMSEATGMGVDQERFDLMGRASSVLTAHPERLPPRDRVYAQLFTSGVGGRNYVEGIRGRERIVRAVPDKPGAWYELADYIFHRSYNVGLEDAPGQAVRAFQRALELDPGLNVVRQHLLWHAFDQGDSAFVRAEAPIYLEDGAGSDGEPYIRFGLAYVLGDTVHARWVEAAIDTMSYGRLVGLWGLPSAGDWPPEIFDRYIDAMERRVSSQSQRLDWRSRKFRMLRNAGRTSAADEALIARERIAGPVPRFFAITDHLYWAGPEDAALRAAAEVSSRLDGRSDPVAWNAGGWDLCALEIWRIREGDLSRVDDSIGRLRAGANQPDPALGRSPLCALLLETMAADARDDPMADDLLEQLRAALDMGPDNQGRIEANIESARLLESRGEYTRAADAMYSPNFNTTLPTIYYSFIVRETGRLADLAGEHERALRMYKHWLVLFQDADPEFDAVRASVAARVEELTEELSFRPVPRQ